MAACKIFTPPLRAAEPSEAPPALSLSSTAAAQPAPLSDRTPEAALKKVGRRAIAAGLTDCSAKRARARSCARTVLWEDVDLSEKPMSVAESPLPQRFEQCDHKDATPLLQATTAPLAPPRSLVFAATTAPLAPTRSLVFAARRDAAAPRPTLCLDEDGDDLRGDESGAPHRPIVSRRLQVAAAVLSVGS